MIRRAANFDTPPPRTVVSFHWIDGCSSDRLPLLKTPGRHDLQETSIITPAREPPSASEDPRLRPAQSASRASPGYVSGGEKALRPTYHKHRTLKEAQLMHDVRSTVHVSPCRPLPLLLWPVGWREATHQPQVRAQAIKPDYRVGHTRWGPSTVVHMYVVS